MGTVLRTVYAGSNVCTIYLLVLRTTGTIDLLLRSESGPHCLDYELTNDKEITPLLTQHAPSYSAHIYRTPRYLVVGPCQGLDKEAYPLACTNKSMSPMRYSDVEADRPAVELGACVPKTHGRCIMRLISSII